MRDLEMVFIALFVHESDIYPVKNAPSAFKLVCRLWLLLEELTLRQAWVGRDGRAWLQTRLQISAEFLGIGADYRSFDEASSNSVLIAMMRLRGYNAALDADSLCLYQGSSDAIWLESMAI